MKLISLGINGPYPAPGGACSGHLLISDSGRTRVLLDMGSGVLGRLLRFCPVDSLSAIVLSHLHFDHVSDMTVLKYLLQFHPLEKRLPVYAPCEPSAVIALLEDSSLEIAEPCDAEIGEMRLSFIPAVHPVPGVCVRVECDGKAFVYTGDTNQNPNLAAFAEGADLLLADAGLTEDKWTPRSPHLSAALSGELACAARCSRLVLTHLNPDKDPGEVLKEARRAFPRAELLQAETPVVI